MTEAAGHMQNAATQLKSAKLKAALPPEEKAFQSLNRIEAMYRNFQIAYGQMGGAAMNGAQRDLARMFDLEMDLSKNQYETAQSAHPAASAQQKKIDEAFAKLQALARRQQQLAMRHHDQKPFEQRWQEERLRREAEQLRRQMQQMAGGSQGQAGSASGQTGGATSGQMKDAMQQAEQALRQAEQALRQAADGNSPGAEQRAAEQLARAQNALNNALHRQSETSLADLQHQAQQLTDAQRRIAEKMKQMYGSSPDQLGSSEQARNKPGPGGGVPMPEMNDPMHPIPYGYGRYWYRRGYLRRFTPPHMPTPEERTLSSEKERLAKKVENLQQKLQEQVQNMAAAQPGAAEKLRQALAALQQEDLAMRMRKTAEWMRQGFGGLNLSTEQSLTQGLQQLSRNLGQTEQAMRSGKPGRQGQGNQTEEALNDLRALRQQMQQARGQQTKQAQGQSPGQQGNSQAEDGAWGPIGAEGPGVDRDDLKTAITDLNRLRAKMRPNDHSYRDLDYALGYLVRLYHANPNVLRSAINEDAVAHLERLELELSRQVNGQAASAARTAAPETAPRKYRDAVANYFKKLSQ
jgi:DNA repair exonuclease SbcCD ATPase subunit